ncbi:MAG: MAPEG family protein [Chakrabartia sp.]
MILSVTMTFAGIAAIVNFWLALRVGQVRHSENVSIGDGGNEAVIRRMRAHSNYIESAPFVLILIGVIEYAHNSGPAPTWLWLVGGLYFLGRVAHGVGMDGGKLGKGRALGTVITMVTLLGLGLYAIATPYLAAGRTEAPTTLDMQTAEPVSNG